MTNRDDLLVTVAHIPMWINEEERLALFDLACKVPQGGNILEIGCLYGGSTAILGLGSPTAKIVSIDKFSWEPAGKASPEQAYKNLASVGVQNVTIRNEDSLKSVHEGYPIDLLFIDGGHDFEFVYHDIMTFGSSAMVIAMHDFSNPATPGVEKAFIEFQKVYPDWKVFYSVHFLTVLTRNGEKFYERKLVD